jgi:NAD(P)H-hydrate repair Nnr-like enzyme with NAD(P)H-hydrate dehydratase domain
MRVLGYGFEDEEEAQEALEALAERYELGPADNRVALLADAGTVLAVRAREDNLDNVKELLAEHGGEQLTEVEDRWTRARDDGGQG